MASAVRRCFSTSHRPSTWRAPVLAVLGDADPHRLQADAAVAFLVERRAAVHVERLEAGHDLTPDDGAAVAAWLRAHDLAAT